jgi:hypothetical protein
MCLDRPRPGPTSMDQPASIDQHAPTNQRVIFLEVLGQVIRETFRLEAALRPATTEPVSPTHATRRLSPRTWAVTSPTTAGVALPARGRSDGSRA